MKTAPRRSSNIVAAQRFKQASHLILTAAYTSQPTTIQAYLRRLARVYPTATVVDREVCSYGRKQRVWELGASNDCVRSGCQDVRGLSTTVWQHLSHGRLNRPAIQRKLPHIATYGDYRGGSSYLL